MAETYLDRYEVVSEVGRGGMAVVYRGTDHVLHRPVAIKVLHPHLSQKPEARARFAREARVIAKLRHPNVVEVYDFSDEDCERSFIIQEFVPGDTLAAFMEHNDTFLPEIGALLVMAIGRALQHAHDHGVIHRDIKPENIMVRSDGVLKLMDFGIAHVTDMEHLTMTGAIIGSPAHMSPEQVDGKALDGRTDIFSLGTLFFMAVTGRMPFISDTASGLLRAIAEARVPDIRAITRSFPDDLYLILLKMMARSPANRYQTAGEVVEDIGEITSSLGLEADSVELKRFFADPEGHSASVGKRVVAGRLNRADRFMRDGSFALTIRELDVILAADPDNEDAKKCLDKARRAARRKALSKTTVMMAVAVGLVLGTSLAAYKFVPDAFKQWTNQNTQEAARAGLGEPPAPVGPSLKPGGTPRRPLERIESTKTRHTVATRRSRPEAAARKGRELLPVVIQANPPAVRIEVDGVFKGFGTTGRIMLPAGRRKVRLTHPRCDICRSVEYTFNLDPANPLKAPLRYSIAYKDASLMVNGPAGGRVLVNGVPRGGTNRLLKVPMRQPGPLEVTVAVSVKGGPTRTTRATLSPAKTTVVAVE
ncbi:MAG: serine/threonine protein kinase [Deltaproteobacteria bacterium]|nr:serine/threonine protein kinase [Deltaproteobacteria bacterium]